MVHNYATLEISREDDDVRILIRVKNETNFDILEQTLYLHRDMTYNEVNQRYSNMCKQAHNYSKKI